MRNTFFRLLAVGLGLTASFAGAGDITIKGSDTMVLLCQKWAETYMREHPTTKIQVTGGGSGTGIAALRNDATDIASSSRKMKAEETANVLAKHGARPLEIKTALDGVCIFVHADNPLKEISIAQLEQIFRGQVQNWSQVGGPDLPIVIYSRENSSGTYSYFKEVVLKEADFSARALTMPGTAALINAVGKDKNGIGYGGAGYATGVKVLAVKAAADQVAVLPSEATIQNHQYPLSRPLFFYALPAQVQGELKQFVDWVTGPNGQGVVKDIGYFPLAGSVAGGESKPGVPPANVVPSAPVAVAAPEPVKATATVVTAAPAAPAAPMITASAASFESLIDREVMLAKRELAEALREEALAKREARQAEREAKLAERESAVLTKAGELYQREVALQEKELAGDPKKAKKTSGAAPRGAWWQAN